MERLIGGLVISAGLVFPQVVWAAEVVFENVVGQDSLTRFDKPKSSQRRKKKRNSGKPLAAGATKPNHSNARNKKQTGTNSAPGGNKPNPRNKNRNKPNNPKK